MEAKDIIKFLFPEEVLTYFEIVEVRDKQDELRFVLEEKNQLPAHLEKSDYESKGFSEPVKLQDFPIRDRAVFLLVKRRKWVEKKTGKVIQRQWDLTAEGTKYTREFGAFLKGIIG